MAVGFHFFRLTVAGWYGEDGMVGGINTREIGEYGLANARRQANKEGLAFMSIQP
jgi:hypothetical protein